ncbi:MAG: hypothetical protein ACRD0U_20845, partial [Acidimicrobiales bacterium]
AILRNRLFDIDIVIRKSVVYAVLWSAVGALYLAVAALPGLVVGERVPIGAAIGLTVLATLVFQPARRAVELAVGRMLFGVRPTKFELLTRFGEWRCRRCSSSGRRKSRLKLRCPAGASRVSNFGVLETSGRPQTSNIRKGWPMFARGRPCTARQVRHPPDRGGACSLVHWIMPAVYPARIESPRL